ncbi:MAG TPA: hypothetical protein VJT49_01205 [Amycolatopsis sp.]|uniref:hypothetical protein n=1 Tax=Amycolatopsis sp. TaxID=37632 RepID=UPI002B499ADB|nr:hypothetical protein [Amycolatopsis sp.]HKS43732.1 hypothetical protein [Amycolatopsis sp.]
MTAPGAVTVSDTVTADPSGARHRGASLRELRHRLCLARRRRYTGRRCGQTGKRAFLSQEVAEEVLGLIWACPHPGRRVERRAYRCPHCRAWHLTRQPTPSRPQPEGTATR